MAAAAAVTDERRAEECRRVGLLRDRFLEGLCGAVPEVVPTIGRGGSPAATVVAGNAHVCFEGHDSEELLFLLDEAGVCASAASACASGATRRSHVLSAMGVPDDLARGAVRFTFGHDTTDEDVERALGAIADACSRLSAARPIGCGSMRVLVGLSGGVDSAVAAALLVEQGHDVVGATMKLWGGPADQGCCSVSDVDDARRSAQQLGVDHHVFNFSEDFDRLVVDPYVADHRAGRTPNPCVECNRHLKFDRLSRRAEALGFDAVATGHHARRRVEGRPLGARARGGPGQGPELRSPPGPGLGARLDPVPGR